MTLHKSLVCLAIASLSIPAMAAPVTTEGAGVGKHGDVIAAVTFDGGRIQAIDIRKSNENPILAGKVFTEMKDAMIKHNTADIDAVTGATVSSDALRNAVKEAAAKAGVTLAGPVALLKRAPKVPETNVYDVVVIGAGSSVRAARASRPPSPRATRARRSCFSKRCPTLAATRSFRARKWPLRATGSRRSSALKATALNCIIKTP